MKGIKRFKAYKLDNMCVCVTTQLINIRERCVTIKRIIQMLKLLKGQKILKNYKIYFLQISETKKNVYNYTIENYKRKIDYLQKNNTWYSH